jgi:hypothetical protein
VRKREKKEIGSVSYEEEGREREVEGGRVQYSDRERTWTDRAGQVSYSAQAIYHTIVRCAARYQSICSALTTLHYTTLHYTVKYQIIPHHQTYSNIMSYRAHSYF